MDALRLSLAARQGNGPLGLLLPAKGSGSTGRFLMLVKLSTSPSSIITSIITVNFSAPRPLSPPLTAASGSHILQGGLGGLVDDDVLAATVFCYL